MMDESAQLIFRIENKAQKKPLSFHSAVDVIVL
jgi:hypothetical protein